jgi:hypothetical protein
VEQGSQEDQEGEGMKEGGAVSGVVVSCSSPFWYSILVKELISAHPLFRYAELTLYLSLLSGDRRI